LPPLPEGEGTKGEALEDVDDMSDAALLQLRNVRKTFPGVVALAGVDFVARRGEIHALMGENGAGKSTLIKVLTGAYPRDAGEMLLEGAPIDPRSPMEAQKLGISTVYQEVNLIPTLSVAENIFLGRQPRRLGRIDWKQIRRRSIEALERLSIRIDVDRQLSSYSIAIQQMVAIARALDVRAKLLVLDEPTSSLDAGEVEQLFSVMRDLRRQQMGIVFVSHFLDQIYAVSDRITVLRNGNLVGEYATAELPRGQLIAKMMGRELAEFEHQPRESQSTRKAASLPLLSARGVGRAGSMQPFDLDIRSGETVGLAGLLGSGRTETARLLFGIDRPDSGTVAIDGVQTNLSSPRRAIRHGLAFCPEDRKTSGIIPDLSVRENIVLALAARGSVLRSLSRRQQSEIADRYIRALGIATPHAEQAIKNLSGGNQQKAILARWLAAQPRLLILDEPTRGIDVGAKAEIQKLTLSLVAEGMSVLFISSELEEVVRVSDRVAVLRDRAKIAELEGERISEQTIMHTIAGERTT
jgi:monosaccharide-transporting ATPase